VVEDQLPCEGEVAALLVRALVEAFLDVAEAADHFPYQVAAAAAFPFHAVAAASPFLAVAAVAYPFLPVAAAEVAYPFHAVAADAVACPFLAVAAAFLAVAVVAYPFPGLEDAAYPCLAAAYHLEYCHEELAALRVHRAALHVHQEVPQDQQTQTKPEGC
jgi:hypothetical protein